MKKRNDDEDFIAEVLPQFVSEAREQVARIEQLLLELEQEPDNRELLDALFRCAHTVKGSSGMFGLDQVVAFTHHVETLLDMMRGGTIVFSNALGTLLLECNDQILVLVDAATDENADSAAHQATRQALVVRLQKASGAEALASVVERSTPTAGPSARHWQISVQFGLDTFRNGMDPLTILHNLNGMGVLSAIDCHVDTAPPLDQLDPESCHLGFEMQLETDAKMEAIESAFSLVREDCKLEIHPLASQQEAIAAKIMQLPDETRLGEILLAGGAITQGELDHALKAQGESSENGKTLKLGDVIKLHTSVSEQVIAAGLQKQQRRRDSTAGSDDTSFIRVHADRLDAVINLLGELAIASAGASLLARQFRQSALIEANTEIGRLIEDIRNGTLQLRMIPIGETFSKFRRAVRDTAGSLGKQVELWVFRRIVTDDSGRT